MHWDNDFIWSPLDKEVTVWNLSSVIQRQPLNAAPLRLVLHQAEDVMGIQFQAMQQNASLSFLPCVISSAVWLQRDALKVGSFKARKRKGKGGRELDVEKAG